MHASSLPLPGGTVRARHGLLPAPAPATLEILARVAAPTRPSPVLGELVTPTGAAILAELATFEQPMMRVRRVGYGYGTKELPWPNAVRVWLGEAWAPAPPRPAPAQRSGQTNVGATHVGATHAGASQVGGAEVGAIHRAPTRTVPVGARFIAPDPAIVPATATESATAIE